MSRVSTGSTAARAATALRAVPQCAPILEEPATVKLTISAYSVGSTAPSASLTGHV